MLGWQQQPLPPACIALIACTPLLLSPPSLTTPKRPTPTTPKPPAGVVLFAKVAGFLPVHTSAGNKQELCQRIMAGTYTAPEAMSPALKDLLSRMLTTDPDARIKFDQVRALPLCPFLCLFLEF